MILQLSVKNQSIESSGITNDYKEAICEYVWNGFEAHATEVNIDYSLNIASGVSELSISDNGDGIVYDDLSDTFGAFLTSQKNLLSLKMKSKANKGKGRFSFSAFATGAKWITTYKDSDSIEYKAYEIVLENDKKEVLSYTEPKVSAIRKAGTKVEFDNIFSLTAENMAFEVLEPALLKEFAWFLYLCKGRNLKININGKPIEYEKYINTEFSEKTVRQMIEERKTFPEFPDDPYGKMQKQDLEKVTKEIYKIEPKIFYKLKPVQEKSLLGFLNLLLNSRERENVLTIVEQIVELTPEQRQDFSDMLRKTKLENVIDTIKFVQDRYKVIELLRTIVFDMTQYANERDHIQKIVQQHFWLFGEQFNLASADERMKNALEKYINILYGVKDIEATLDEDAEQERRMDIFMCNVRDIEASFGTTMEENIIVELKAPKVILSKKVLRQIEDYMDFVRKQPNFNSEYRRWKFIAVCKEVDEDVKGRYKTFEDKGKIGLVIQVENYEVYALTWDDVFKSFELRHAPLLKRLNYDREKLAKELMKEIENEEGRDKVNALTNIAIGKIGDVS